MARTRQILPLSAAIIGALIAAPPGHACAFQAHALGAFVAFDAAGGWWAWDGWLGSDALSGDVLDPGSNAELIRYSEHGRPVAVRLVPAADLAAAWEAAAITDTLVLSDERDAAVAGSLVGLTAPDRG